ncbi:WxL domain-containing protein [Companilactobacillus keshanensis]|uniref:WxL domain-containing protein n=1 Tax=Companilactobacillus keshanensis TaxID=2486003 RepID=A0ABW4BW60_9LACO|nr:WxL domain-containing protein [Companilactobacillus keshanensis]
MIKFVKGFAALGALALALPAGLITAKAATTGSTAVTTTTASSPSPLAKSTDVGLQQTGSLALDSAPNISFGTQPLAVGKTTYTSSTFDSTLHVTNPGFPSGWSVSVADSGFADATSKAPLKGATLSLEAPTIAADDSTNQSTPPTTVSPIAVSSAASTVVDATAGEGIGAYTGTFASGDASLYVPAGNIGGSYTSTLTWSLLDAPA